MPEFIFAMMGSIVGTAIGILWFMPNNSSSFIAITKWQKRQEDINKDFIKYFDEIEKELARRPYEKNSKS